MLTSERDDVLHERIRFERLLQRVERQISTHSTPASTREATLWVKALFALRARLTALEPSIEQPLLAAYVKRVNNLWTLSKADAIIQTQQSKMRENSALNKRIRIEKQSFVEPPLRSASHSFLDPNFSHHANQPIKESHPIADAAHFSISKPSQDAKDVRAELFQSTIASHASQKQIGDDPGASLAHTYDSELTRLAELAPALKHQVKSIADALKVDEAIVDEASRSMEDNVERVQHENVRLKAWARASCGETCALSGIIVVLITVFVAMVAIIKVVPAPR